MTDLCPNCRSKVTFAQPTDHLTAAFNDENPAWSCNSCGRSGDTLELEAAEREAAATAMSTDDLLDQLDNAGHTFVCLHRSVSPRTIDNYTWGASGVNRTNKVTLSGCGPTRHAALAALVAQLDAVKA